MDTEARKAVRTLQSAGLTVVEAFLRGANYDDNPSLCIQANIAELKQLTDDLLTHWSRRMAYVELPFDEVLYGMGIYGFFYMVTIEDADEEKIASITYLIRIRLGHLSTSRHQLAAISPRDSDFLNRRILGAVGRIENITYGPSGRLPQVMPRYEPTLLFKNESTEVVQIKVELL